MFNRQAGPPAARARITRDQGLAALRRLEMQVASEVRSARAAPWRPTHKRVESTRAARRPARSSRLDAEQKKFAAGMSTELPRHPGPARPGPGRGTASCVPVADHRKSLVEFDARISRRAAGGVTLRRGRTSAHQHHGGDRRTGGNQPRRFVAGFPRHLTARPAPLPSGLNWAICLLATRAGPVSRLAGCRGGGGRQLVVGASAAARHDVTYATAADRPLAHLMEVVAPPGRLRGRPAPSRSALQVSGTSPVL